MKQTKKQNTLIAILLLSAIVFIITLDSSFNQTHAYESEVVLTGTFVQKWNKGDFHTFQLVMRDKKKLFNITKLDTVDATGWKYLEEIFPPVLVLTGDDKTINLLKQDNTMDKTFEIRGDLYPPDGVLFVESVKEVSK